MPQYSPMQSVRALSGIQGAMGGQGLLWESEKKGLSRRAIQDYVNKQATKATEASSGIGRSRFWGKLASLATMAIPGWKESQLLLQLLAGAGVGGAVTKIGSERATQDLRREAGPDVLYGLPEKEEAESYAHSAVDTLLSSIDPGAISAAVTTPLEYLTMQMLTPITGGTGGTTTGGEASKYAAGDIGKLFSAGQSGYGQRGFQDLLSLAGRGTGSGGDIPFIPQNPYDYSALLNNPRMRLGFPR